MFGGTCCQEGVSDWQARTGTNIVDIHVGVDQAAGEKRQNPRRVMAQNLMCSGRLLVWISACATCSVPSGYSECMDGKTGPHRAIVDAFVRVRVGVWEHWQCVLGQRRGRGMTSMMC